MDDDEVFCCDSCRVAFMDLCPLECPFCGGPTAIKKIWKGREIPRGRLD